MIPYKIGFTRLEEEEEKEEEKPLVSSVITGKSNSTVTENDGNSVSAACGKQVVTAKVSTALLCFIFIPCLFGCFGMFYYFIVFSGRSSFFFSSFVLFRFHFL
jgi:hypothetical protein